MIDMHSHILYGVDDGPKTKEETIKMLEKAVEEGITDIISTSHSNHPMFDVKANTVFEQVNELQQEINNRQLPLTIHMGHEARIFDSITVEVLEKRIHLLAKSNYLLLELPSCSVPQYTTHIISQLLSQGITVIIAHPERNKAIAEKPERLERLIRAGAVAQITAGSLAGHFGKSVQQLSLNLVRANLVHTYGSDVHNLETRPFLFNEGLDFLEKKKELDAIDLLLENNARIIENKPFIIYEPEEVRNRKVWGFFKF